MAAPVCAERLLEHPTPDVSTWPAWRRPFNILFLFGSVIFTLSYTVAFTIAAKRHRELALREPLLIWMSFFGFMVSLVVHVGVEIVGYENARCDVYTLAIGLVPCLVALPIVVRLGHLYTRLKLASEISTLNFNEARTQVRLQSNYDHFKFAIASKYAATARNTSKVMHDAFSKKHQVDLSVASSAGSRSQLAIGDSTRSGIAADGAGDQMLVSKELNTLLNNKWKSGALYSLAILLLYSLPFIITLALQQGLTPYLGGAGCLGCFMIFRDALIIAGLTAYIAILSVYAAWKLRQSSDQFGIARETFLAFAFGCAIGIIGHLVMALDSGNVWSSGKFPVSHMTPWAILVAFAFVVVIPYHRAIKRAKEDAESERVIARSSIAAIAPLSVLAKEDPDGLRLFEEHLESEFASENLKFYQLATEWKKSYFDQNPKLVFLRAKRLYANFIILNAPMWVNLPAAIYTDLQKIFSKPGLSVDDLTPDTFNSACTEIDQILTKGPLRRFLASKKWLAHAAAKEQKEQA